MSEVRSPEIVGGSAANPKKPPEWLIVAPHFPANLEDLSGYTIGITDVPLAAQFILLTSMRGPMQAGGRGF